MQETEHRRKILTSKKGQAQVAVGAIVTLIVGVGVATLVMIFVGSLGGQTYNLVESDIDSIANNGIVNETFTPIVSTAVALDNDFVQSGTLSVVDSSDASIALGNFTIDYGAGTMTLTNAAYNNTALNASYTHGDTAIRNSIKNGIKSSFDAMENTGDYLPIVVLAVVISLVLALVLSFTAFGGSGGSNSAL